jgi:hypothetical protein
MSYDLGSKGKNCIEGFCRFYHGTHRDRGINYDGECPICNGKLDKYYF